eukprot:GILK01001869.1.p1 GENE.GILK01001869.1~~GILK01001869.1.p1  ORF type:complete len:504 (+),score=76.50 GILK01001869.1:32-1543(+)
MEFFRGRAQHLGSQFYTTRAAKLLEPFRRLIGRKPGAHSPKKPEVSPILVTRQEVPPYDMEDRFFPSVENLAAREKARASHGYSLRTECFVLAIMFGSAGYIIMKDRQRERVSVTFSEAVYRQLISPLVQRMDPELSHRVAVLCAKYGLFAGEDPSTAAQELRVNLWGKTFPHPVGLAAGFDKNAEAVDEHYRMGFGFAEIGSVTPEPQEGNPKPRVFRLVEDQAVINRYGFNSDGMNVVADRLKAFRESGKRGIIGVNLGKNKTTEDAASDFVKGVDALAKYADYLVINVSSPNTPGLRALQSKEHLIELLTRTISARDALPWGKADYPPQVPPLLLKIAPDLTEQDVKDIAEVALKLKLDGLIISNTTVSRPESLRSPLKSETGGLSGRPLFDLSTDLLGKMYVLTHGKIPLVAAGGVSTAEDVMIKILNGASLVQMYTALVYEGPFCISRMPRELRIALHEYGFTSMEQAVGHLHKPRIAAMEKYEQKHSPKNKKWFWFF